ncbi:unnamed protein product [Caenorhabditis brenneri]
MPTEYDDVTGQEHLPKVLKFIADQRYQYSRRKHTTEVTPEGIEHNYSLLLSCQPFKNQKKTEEYSNMSTLNQPFECSDDLISQISSTTTSEMKSISSKSRSPVASMKELKKKTETAPSSEQYITLPTITPTVSTKSSSCESKEASNVSSSSDSSYVSIPISIPKCTYSSVDMKSTRSGKYVMMVHVKFVFLHLDKSHRLAQSCFSDEFPSDCLLQGVMCSFYDSCNRQLKNTGNKLNPRVSYCVGKLNYLNSKPLMKEDLKKSLAELARTSTVVQFSLIANNAD